MSAVDIIERGGDLLVSSETIAEGTENQHKNVLQLIRTYRDDLEEFGRVESQTRPFETAGGTQYREVFLLNEPQATLILTYMRNMDRIREFKKALVRAFFDMARRLTAPPVPQSLPDALRAYALEVEQREALEAKVAADAPKVHFAEAVAASPSTILIGELAKILRGNGIEIGQNRLFERLREEGYLIRRPGSDWNMPTQRAMDLGLFRIKESTQQSPDGSVRVTKTTKVTGKGQQYFIDRYAPRQDAA